MSQTIIFAMIILSIFTSCDNKESLQRYYVDNQDNKEFVKVDIPASMFTKASSLDPEQQKILETIKKINLLAVPKKADNAEIIDNEKEKISKILTDEKYQLLIKYGGEGRRVEMYYTGEEEAIDEIILFGYDGEKGVGIARLLGENMNPSDILNLYKSMESGDVNIDGLNNVTNMFIEATETEPVAEPEIEPEPEIE